MALYDVTRPITTGMVCWPGHPEPAIEPHCRLEEGAPANVSRLLLSTHTGTHVDPPLHFLAGGTPVDELPLDVLIGPARVIEFAAGPTITAGDLRALPLAGVERLLLKTRNSARLSEPFFTDYVHIDEGAARLLLDAGVRLLGSDGLAVEAFNAPGSPVHHLLLGRGVVILEGLDLSAVPAGDYELIALPLKVRGGDGAPARVVLRGR